MKGVNVDGVNYLLKNRFDMHVHGAPDIVPRKLNEIELAKQAKSVGMKGILLKCHYALTADRAWLVRQCVPGIHVFGGIVLNLPVTGGLNPEAVSTAIKFGAKEIWMPTISAANHLKYEGKDPKMGINILSKTGELVPSVIEILNIIAESNVILGTGHLSPEETQILVSTAKKLGVKKILVTHPEWKLVNMSVKVQVELSKIGAIMEHCYYATTKLGGGLNPKEIAMQIKAVGAEHCIMATDLGQALNPNPIDAMKSFIKDMIAHGISMKEIDLMTIKNPAKLLELPL